MLKINQVTSDSLQKQTLILPDGTPLVFTLYFQPQQFGWFIKELTYADFKVKSIRVCNNFNILHQFKNKIPFGLACISADDREPMFIEDFSTGKSVLYILTSEEVKIYTEFLQND